jgi:GT2 family glycosyltransferase
VIHVDLAREFPPLMTTADELCVVFWWCGVPLGHAKLGQDRLPLPPAAVVDLMATTVAPAVLARLSALPPAGGAPALESQPLHRLRRELESARQQSVEERPACSVVICTRNRPEQLASCLHSLERQSFPPLEILVIDNAPASDATRRLVEDQPGLRYVLEPRSGLDIARNTGIRQSTGPIVAFTDDDVVLHEHWISGMQRAFRDPEVAVVTGPVLAAEIDTEAQAIFEDHWGFNRGYCRKDFGPDFFRATRARACPVWEIGAGASMAIRRSVLQEIGGFDERLDVGAAGCNGDSELWYRVLAAGGTCRYDPDVVAFHSHRRNMVALQRQIHYYMRGFVVALLIQFERTGDLGNLRHLILTLPAWYLRLLLRGVRRGWSGRQATLGAELTGAISGLRFYLRHRRPRRRPQASEVVMTRS